MKAVFLLVMTFHIVTSSTTDSPTPENLTPLGDTTGRPTPGGDSDPPSTSTHKPPLGIHRTEAPMLGHIFDTHSALNKHHHHDHKWGPHFEEQNTASANITVQSGQTANLNCRISLLQDKTVSWVRRKSSAVESSDLQLLTVGYHTYSGDPRYSVQFQYPNNWRLQITRADKRDEGTYECQVSTHPPRLLRLHLHVNAPEVEIVDVQGNPLLEKYYEEDSTIQLDCIVRHVTMTSSVVYWIHVNKTLNYDTTRGGISVKTYLFDEGGANSSLSVARVNKSDSGPYTCSISATQFSTVTVHVLSGESLAELHHVNHGSRTQPPRRSTLVHSIGLLLFLLLATS